MDDRIFTSGGSVIDPVDFSVLGRLPAWGRIAVAPEIHRAFTATVSQIEVTDLTTYSQLRSIAFPPMVWDPKRIIRYGPRGLALLYSGGVGFIDDVIVP